MKILESYCNKVIGYDFEGQKSVTQKKELFVRIPHSLIDDEQMLAGVTHRLKAVGEPVARAHLEEGSPIEHGGDQFAHLVDLLAIPGNDFEEHLLAAVARVGLSGLQDRWGLPDVAG